MQLFLFFFFRWNLVCRPRVASEDRGNWDKNRDDFHSMEMSLVMSKWFILGMTGITRNVYHV